MLWKKFMKKVFRVEYVLLDRGNGLKTVNRVYKFGDKRAIKEPVYGGGFVIMKDDGKFNNWFSWSWEKF